MGSQVEYRALDSIYSNFTRKRKCLTAITTAKQCADSSDQAMGYQCLRFYFHKTILMGSSPNKIFDLSPMIKTNYLDTMSL